MKFVVQYKPAKENFLAVATDADLAAVGAHFAYLESLLAEGRLIFAGRRHDAAFGLGVFTAASLAEAEATIAKDPVVKAGVFHATVGEFSFALASEPKLLED